MTAGPDCKPWCTNHKNLGEDACFSQVTIYHNGDDDPAPQPAPGSMAALFEFPKDIAWVSFVVSQDEDDEQPIMELDFFEAGKDEPISRLSLDENALRQIHRNLGAVLRDLAESNTN